VSPTKSWVVALGASGEVLGADGGAPLDWIGATLMLAAAVFLLGDALLTWRDGRRSGTGAGPVLESGAEEVEL
jgi:hypothetical protein